MLNVNPHWRIVTRSNYTPFAAGDHGRPLRIVIDDTTVSPSFELTMLRSFANRPTAEIVGTASDPERHVAIGQADQFGHIPIEYILPNGEGFHAAISEGQQWRQLAEETEQRDGVPASEALRALVLAQFCSQYDVDALVTEAPLLQLRFWRNLAKNSKAQNAASAVALLGLHLRAHRDFTVRCEASSTFLKEEQYYRGAAAAALASYPSVFNAAQGFWRVRRDPSPVALLQGIEIRLGRALRARDYFHVRIRSFSPTETWDDALFFFEFLLLLLSGALDASARFYHRIFDLEGNERRVSWRSRDWRKALRRKLPVLKDLADEARNPTLIANAIGILRNFIHGEALSQEFHFGEHDDGKPLTVDFQPGVLALPPEEGQQLRQIIRLLGDEEGWGIQDGFKGVVLVLPARFLERAVRATFASLDQVIGRSNPLLSHYREEHFNPRFFIPGYSYSKELLALTGLGSPQSREE